MPDFCVVPIRDLPPTILIIEGIRNGRADGHPEPRVTPSDHSHAFPVFEDFLQTPQSQGSQRLNTAHTHLVTPILPRQLAQGMEDAVQFQRGAGLRCVLAHLRHGLWHVSISVLSGTTASPTGCTSARRSASPPPSAPEISNVASARVTETAGDEATWSLIGVGAAWAAAGAYSVTGVAQVPAGDGATYSIMLGHWCCTGNGMFGCHILGQRSWYRIGDGR